MANLFMHSHNLDFRLVVHVYILYIVLFTDLYLYCGKFQFAVWQICLCVYTILDFMYTRLAVHVYILDLSSLLTCTSTVVNFNLLYGKCIHAYSRNLRLHAHMGKTWISMHKWYLKWYLKWYPKT